MVRKTGHEGLVQREITVKRGNKSFKQLRWVKASEDEPDKIGILETFEGKFKPDLPIKFMGKDLIIEKVSEKEKTIKLSDGNVYTVGAIEKFGKLIEPETKKEIETIKNDIESLKNDIKEVKEDKKPKPKVEIKPKKTIKVKSKVEKEKPEKELGIKLTPTNYKDILVEGKWINIDGKSAVITKFEMDMFITCRLENGKDVLETTFALFDKDVKSEDKKLPIPDKYVFKPVRSEKTVKGEMKIDNVDEIKSLKDMAVEGGVNEQTTHVVKFKGGSQAIYKNSGAVSTQGEMNFKGISKILNWDNAPETTEVDLGKGNGSCQRWVEDIAIDDINEVTLTEKHYDDLAKIAIIDMITGNWDRHYNNVRLDMDGKIWAIDNDTWGDETRYNVNKIKSEFYTCKLGGWSNTSKKDNVDQFQSYCDKHVKDVIEHKDEIIKFINDIKSDKNKFKDDFKGGFKGGFDDTYKSVNELTDNMLNNLNRLMGDKI